MAANAQDILEHGRGYEPEPEAVYRSVPAVPRFRAFLPDEVDLSADFPTPGNQGQQGSCTAWATGYALRSYYENRNQSVAQRQARRTLFSPAFLYNQLHADGDCKGTAISRALELMQSDGVASLDEFPYTAADCRRQPDDKVKAVALQYRIKSWRRLDETRPDDAKGQLAKGNPVVFGMNLSPSFDRLKGDAVYDDTEAPRTGGHAMVLVGYSDKRQAFKFINSWNTTWADGGFGWVSYRALGALSDRQFVIDVEPRAQPVVVDVPVVPVVVVVPAPPPVPAPAPAPVVVVPPPVVVPVIVVAPPAPAPAPVPPPVNLPVAATARANEVPCARITASVDANRAIRLSGFSGAAEDFARLAKDLMALPGVSGVSGNIETRPWPQCEVFLKFDEALATRNGLAVELKGASRNLFRAGDSLAIEVTTPSYPSYLYVSYLQASGEVVNLAWPVGKSPKAVPPNTRLTFGGGANGQPVYRVGAPFGDEIVVVVASPQPLFDQPLPDTANDRDYLTSFRQAFALQPVGGPAAGAGTRALSAATATLRTQP
jgi:hypothetical protein